MKPAPRDVQKPAAQTREMPKQGKPQGDRGYTKPEVRPAAKPPQADRPAAPAARPGQSGGNRTAVSGGKSGSQERAASQRGKQSMPQGARSKGGGGGGKQRR